MGTYECFLQTEFGGFWLRDQILQAENGQKVDKFEPIYRVITKIDKK